MTDSARAASIGGARAGFTLVEILIVVMLSGMVAALALAPVVVTVRRVVEIQGERAGREGLSRALSFIGRDLSGALRIEREPLVVRDHQAFGGGEDDTLIVMTAALVPQGLPAGSVVYAIERGGPLRGDVLPGLYRWTFPGKRPAELASADLRGEEGQLVLPGARTFSAELPGRGEERTKVWRGPLPVGLWLAVGRGEGEEEDVLERAFAFP